MFHLSAITKNRRPFILVHRWLGLSIGLLLLVQGITGTAMVFRDELEPLLHSELRLAPLESSFTAQNLFETVQAAHPGATITRAEFPQSPDQAVLFKLKLKHDRSPVLTAIDPYRNHIVRDGGLSAWPVEWLFVLHEQLFAGAVGEYVVGVEGVLLLVMTITGFLFWWPGLKRFTAGFRVVWRRGPDVRWRTIHRAAGAIAAPILLVTAVTGILMVWKEPFRELLGAAGKPTPLVAEQAERPLLPLDSLVRKARAEFGPARLMQIRFSSDGRVVAVYLDSNHTVRPDGTAQFYYNGYDGTRLATYVAGDQSASSEFVDWLYTVHTGQWSGWLGRILAFSAGLALIGLSLTGPWLWYSRRARRKPAQAPTKQGKS